ARQRAVPAGPAAGRAGGHPAARADQPEQRAHAGMGEIMTEGTEPQPETVADVGRDVMALLRAAVAGDWEEQTAVLNGAEHGGTLRALTEILLGVASQSLVRHMLAEACITTVEPGSLMWDALRTDLDVVLA